MLGFKQIILAAIVYNPQITVSCPKGIGKYLIYFAGFQGDLISCIVDTDYILFAGNSFFHCSVKQR